MLLCGLLLAPLPALALKTDRLKPLEVNADSTKGTLGDGVAVLRGNVEIRQGTLHIRADQADVDKTDGKVTRVTLRGNPAFLEQTIEEQGQVEARADTIVYEVANGIVTLTGNADVHHPQYQIKGEQLKYDLNLQHFQGTGEGDGNSRIHIRLDPEVVPGEDGGDGQKPAKPASDQQTKNGEKPPGSSGDAKKPPPQASTQSVQAKGNDNGGQHGDDDTDDDGDGDGDNTDGDGDGSQPDGLQGSG